MTSIEAISSAGDHRESNEWYRYSHSGRTMASSIAMARERSRTTEISGNRRIRVTTDTVTSEPIPSQGWDSNAADPVPAWCSPGLGAVV